MEKYAGEIITLDKPVMMPDFKFYFAICAPGWVNNEKDFDGQGAIPEYIFLIPSNNNGISIKGELFNAGAEVELDYEPKTTEDCYVVTDRTEEEVK